MIEAIKEKRKEGIQSVWTVALALSSREYHHMWTIIGLILLPFSLHQVIISFINEKIGMNNIYTPLWMYALDCFLFTLCNVNHHVEYIKINVQKPAKMCFASKIDGSLEFKLRLMGNAFMHGNQTKKKYNNATLSSSQVKSLSFFIKKACNVCSI
jgi:hypothetical protein